MTIRRRRQLRRRHGQAVVETIVLIVAVLLATAWAAMAFPRAIKNHYEGNRDVISSPM